MNWKIPVWAAAIGVAVCVTSLAYGQLDLRFNFFHNPTPAEAHSLGNYREPFAEEAIDDAIPVLTPGTILLMVFKDTPHGWDLVVYLGIWAVAAVINMILYGAIGLVLAQIVDATKKKLPHTD
jgi:hypothetical protein